MSEFFQNLSLQALSELDETTNIKFDAINELNIFINQKKNQRLSFNLVNVFKSENKKIEEDVLIIF